MLIFGTGSGTHSNDKLDAVLDRRLGVSAGTRMNIYKRLRIALIDADSAMD